MKRYSTVAPGAITYTGNTLGLNKSANANSPGTSGAIGTFITTDTTQRDGTYPYGTTALWNKNNSRANLVLPSGSKVLYAELIWGGSYNYGGENVTATLGSAVSLTTPAGSYTVSPASTTATTLSGSTYYYVRSADVTSLAQSGGAGTYMIGGVPGTQSSTENNANAAGWTLAVVYGNPSLPVRNMTIFVGGELTNTGTQTTSSVSGFCSPQKGAITARLMVSAIEGDAGITGDQMLFGPTTATMAAVSGPNNPLTNFFSSQINSNSGVRDTTGTFGTANSSPGSNVSGARQGWDITNIDVSARMQNGQTSAYAKGSTTGDTYVLSTIGLQIDVGAPIFPTSVMTVNKTHTYVGDTLTFTVRMDNTAGTADAVNVVYTNTPAEGLGFVAGSVTINGAAKTDANPITGIAIGTVSAGTTTTITFAMKVNALPLPPAPAQYQNTSSWSYQYSSCAGFPLNNGATVTAPFTAVGIPRLAPTKSATPSGKVLPGGTVAYTVTIPNTGTVNSSGTTLADPIPTGTIYVPNSTKLNGTAVADIGGTMPWATARTVNSPGAPAGQISVGASATVSYQVTVAPSPPAIITNIATIDPDGAGPSQPTVVSLTNPPVTADLAIAVSDAQTSAVAGGNISYLATLTNNGPDAIISASLSVLPPPALRSATYTASSGTYDPAISSWTGLNLAAGQSVTLTIAGKIAPEAVDPQTITVNIAAAPGVLDSNSSNNSATDTDTLTLVSDLSVGVTDGKTSVSPGSPTTYTITVANAGPSQVTALTLNDVLNPALQNPVYSPSQGTYNETTGTWTGLSIPPGGTVTLTLRATIDVNFRGNLTYTVSVDPQDSHTDPDLADNTASDTNTTTPSIQLTESIDNTKPAPGTVLTFSIRYANQGGGAARNLAVSTTVPLNTDYLPNSLRIGSATSTYATATPKTDTSGDDEAEEVNGGIVFKINAVAADDGVTGSGGDEGIVYYRATVR